MGRSKSKSRRGLQRTSNLIRLPTRVPSLRVTLQAAPWDRDDAWSPVRSRMESFQNWETTKRATDRAKRSRNLRLVEDRRRFHPEGRRRPARAFNRWAPRIITPGWAALGGAAVTAKLAFAEPSSVAICVRRKQRREVLLARGHGGKKGQRRPKRNWYSNIRCRR